MRNLSIAFFIVISSVAYSQEVFVLGKKQTDFSFSEAIYSTGFRIKHKRGFVDFTSSLQNKKSYFFLAHYTINKKMFVQYNIIGNDRNRFVKSKQAVIVGLKIF